LGSSFLRQEVVPMKRAASARRASDFFISLLFTSVKRGALDVIFYQMQR